ncbi:hypothetical protein [Candidatus Viridilinea mediisalina]|uniref:Uncharacterized protein n=1 Tax=Candidatus Viridilinea mediisalina TaxID=2024553 RepID=A0A2A6RFT8_9CHLR|nr:hypothetical protein [Candidatus Viridilinea mediisalina]PDW01937.1 hypothetical protein CJ255_16600 [Candidatus Viridilinea mediisalina]
MPYADLRVYQERLDQVVGPDNWSVAYQVTNAGVLCALTILGVTKTDVGDWPLAEGNRPDENHLTTAVAQAFKRACATFGVGRFLYNLPKMWADYDDQKRAIVEPQRVIYAMYCNAGLKAFASQDMPQQDAPPSAQSRTKRPQQQQDAPPPAQSRTKQRPQGEAFPCSRESSDAPPPPAQSRTKRPQPQQDASPSAQSRTEDYHPQADAPLATDAQLGMIARLLYSIGSFADQHENAELMDMVDEVGVLVNVPNLSTLGNKEKLRTASISRKAASVIIDKLKPHAP